MGLGLSKASFVPSGSLIREILGVGIPIAVQDAFIQISFLIITMIANLRGVTDAAAVGIVEKIISFLFLVPSSLLSAVSASVPRTLVRITASGPAPIFMMPSRRPCSLAFRCPF